MIQLRFYLLIILLSLCAWPSWATTKLPRQVLCEDHLTDSQKVQQLREEIKVAHASDFNSGRDAAQYSNFIESRISDLAVTPLADAHVISLGSGPDVFLPLYLYPLAKHFHLVDVLSGWGDGPEEIVEEIESRLHSLAQNGTVERLDDWGDWRKIETYVSPPLIWRVRWLSPTLGQQEKIFYLHQLDFGAHESQKEIKNYIAKIDPAARVAGVVVTGISADLETRRFFLDLLAPGGSMYTEMLYVNSEGDTSTPEDEAILNELKKDHKVQMIDTLKPDFLYAPSVFLVEPKR